jgi:hypothetical protein
VFSLVPQHHHIRDYVRHLILEQKKHRLKILELVQRIRRVGIYIMLWSLSRTDAETLRKIQYRIKDIHHSTDQNQGLLEETQRIKTTSNKFC